MGDYAFIYIDYSEGKLRPQEAIVNTFIPTDKEKKECPPAT